MLTLQRKVGIRDDQKQRVERIKAFSADVNKEVLKGKLTARLAELEAEVKSVKAQIKQIDSIDDQMLKTIVDLMKI